MLKLRAVVATCFLASLPVLARGAPTAGLAAVTVEVTRAGSVERGGGNVSGGGVKFNAVAAAVGSERFKTTTITREGAPLVLETSAMGTTVTCDLPGVIKVSPIEIRVERRATSAPDAAETTYIAGTPKYANVTFTGPRNKGESALGAWARAYAAAPGTSRKDVTVAVKGSTGDVRTFVLRGAVPVLYSPLEATSGASGVTAVETLEVRVDRIEVGGTAFGGAWLGAVLRGTQDARGEMVVALSGTGGAPVHTSRYPGSVPSAYRSGELVVGTRGTTERWEIQPGPGAQPY